MKVAFKIPDKPGAPAMSRSGPQNKPRYAALDLDAMLAQEIEDLNRDTEEDRRVQEAVIVAKRDPNKIAGDDDDEDDSNTDDDNQSGSSSHRNRSSGRLVSFRTNNDDYEEELDPELYEITERNRQIVLSDEDHEDTTTSTSATNHRPPELVFSEPPHTSTSPNRIEVSFNYGLSTERPVKKSRGYMVMCDFGEESMYALSWAIGTMLRDGDQIYVASVVNTEENVEDMSEDDKFRLWQELDRKSKILISKVRSILEEMLLYNIKIVIYTIGGPTRESLLQLIRSISMLTMVVCGSREKGALKGLLMGSVSTFLVHNSPVPVSVVRPQKKAKKNKGKMTAAQRLSQSVRSGQLRVDEAAGANAPNLHRHRE